MQFLHLMTWSDDDRSDANDEEYDHFDLEYDYDDY